MGLVSFGLGLSSGTCQDTFVERCLPFLNRRKNGFDFHGVSFGSILSIWVKHWSGRDKTGESRDIDSAFSIDL